MTVDVVAGPEELAALDALVQAAQDNARDERLLARRIDRLRTGRAEGRSWHDLLAQEARPGAMELVTRVLRRLTDGSGTLRRILARGLRAEGATVAAIAERFRVSHQRVSALLRRHGR